MSDSNSGSAPLHSESGPSSPLPPQGFPEEESQPVLLLGVSYSDLKAQLEQEDEKKKFKKEKFESLSGVELVTELVMSKYLNEIDGRDTARCLALEASGKYVTHCVSLQDGGLFLDKKYLYANFNKETFVRQVKEKWCLGTPIYTQVILDYFWIPPGWAEQHWTEKFFSTNLSEFSTILAPAGCVYLPFQEHTFNMVTKNIRKLKKRYSITFLKKWELDEISLWKHTQDIDEDVMLQVFRKKLDQEEDYCTLYNFMKVADDDFTQAALSWLDDIPNIRYIKLRLLSPEEHKISKQYRRKKPLPKIDPLTKAPIHYAGFVHMVGRPKDVTREIKPVYDETQQVRGILSIPPPTFEMLTHTEMTIGTKRMRFLAWRLANQNKRRLEYFTAKALKSATAELVPVPAWCKTWCEAMKVPCGPLEVVSDPGYWEEFNNDLVREFSVNHLMNGLGGPSSSRSSGRDRIRYNMRVILGGATKGLLNFGLEYFYHQSKEAWDKECPALKDVPLWAIHYALDLHLSANGGPQATYDKIVAGERGRLEQDGKRKRKENEKKRSKKSRSKRGEAEEVEEQKVENRKIVKGLLRDLLDKAAKNVGDDAPNEVYVSPNLVTDPLDPVVQIVEQEWTCCDECDVWHVLPEGISKGDLPEGQWTCRMATWELAPDRKKCQTLLHAINPNNTQSQPLPLPQQPSAPSPLRPQASNVLQQPAQSERKDFSIGEIESQSPSSVDSSALSLSSGALMNSIAPLANTNPINPPASVITLNIDDNKPPTPINPPTLQTSLPESIELSQTTLPNGSVLRSAEEERELARLEREWSERLKRDEAERRRVEKERDEERKKNATPSPPTSNCNASPSTSDHSFDPFVPLDGINSGSTAESTVAEKALGGIKHSLGSLAEGATAKKAKVGENPDDGGGKMGGILPPSS